MKLIHLPNTLALYLPQERSRGNMIKKLVETEVVKWANDQITD